MRNTGPERFLHPPKKCDIVMKGGVTSGVVYPSTVVSLAETYQFVNIGGTSAGAIAAAATAAAEYCRANGSGEGFEKLAAVPSFFAGKAEGTGHSNLFTLFQPDPDTRMLFEIAVSFTRTGSARLVSLLGALFRGAWPVWVAVLLLGCLYFTLPALTRFRQSALEEVSVVLWLCVLLLVGVVLTMIRKLRLLPAKGFGLCSGMPCTGSNHPALTEWFHMKLNDIAGKPPDQPLTFGDLNQSGIHLRMISTCLTHRRPYGLPIDSQQFYFRSSEFEEYFPQTVVQWIQNHPDDRTTDASEVDETGFCRLPSASDLPVLVAARMSLSFPFLFRAVPLYAVDFSLARRTDGAAGQSQEPRSATAAKEPDGSALQPGEKRKPERCWFLDGGICSNFPIHMFDAPLPRWPTFGVNLQAIRKDRPDSHVWMPSRNAEGFADSFYRLPSSPALGSLLGYALAMIDSARNWSENRQMSVPGYRDRIVHVRLDEDKEGGLNLDMSPEVVREVSGRGEKAAALLLSHFFRPDPGTSLTWDNHRWIRFRSSFARIEELLQQIERGLGQPEPGEKTYADLLDRGPAEPPNSYRVTQGQRTFLKELMERIVGLAEMVNEAAENTRPSRKQPRPEPELRVLPRTVPARDADRPAAAPLNPRTEGEQSVS